MPSCMTRHWRFFSFFFLLLFPEMFMSPDSCHQSLVEAVTSVATFLFSSLEPFWRGEEKKEGGSAILTTCWCRYGMTAAAAAP